MSQVVRTSSGGCWWWVALVWLVPQAAEAQLNVEAVATRADEPGHHGLLEGAFSLEHGNVNLLEVRGSAAYLFTTAHAEAPEDARAFFFRDRLLGYGSAGITRQLEGPPPRYTPPDDMEMDAEMDPPARTIANDGYLHLRYTRMQWLKAGFEGYFQIQFDEFRLLQRRVVLGGGWRFILAYFDNFASWCGSGYMYEEEEREIPEQDRPPDGPDPINMTNHRWSSYLTLMLMESSDRLALTNTLYVQPRFNAMDDVQLLNELSGSVRFNPYFSFTLGLSVNFDSRAPRSVQRYDIKLTNGIRAQF